MFPAPSELTKNPRQLAAITGGVMALTTLAWWIVWLRRPTAQELERRRRMRLGLMGRIVDGMVTDVVDAESPAPVEGAEAAGAENGGEDVPQPVMPQATVQYPRVLVYSYNIAGVVYECAQDVSTLTHLMDGFRIDLPVQVKYDPRNPYDSIILCEDWKGFRSGPVVKPASKTVAS